MKKLSYKQVKKIIDGKCRFCGNDNYATLDTHRIVPGCEGGKYEEGNTVTICSNCHRMIHDGQIIIHGEYFCTSGKYLIHCTIDGKEQFL